MSDDRVQRAYDAFMGVINEPDRDDEIDDPAVDETETVDDGDETGA